MFLGMLKPLIEEAELIDPNDASDPMAGAIGLADATMVADFFANGAEAVGGIGEGIDFASMAPEAPAPAPTPEMAPSMTNDALPGMEMKMGP